jgi:hypothetical protein
VASVVDRAPFHGHHLRIVVLCGLMMFLDGFDLTSISFAAPQFINELVNAWQSEAGEQVRKELMSSMAGRREAVGNCVSLRQAGKRIHHARRSTHVHGHVHAGVLATCHARWDPSRW